MMGEEGCEKGKSRFFRPYPSGPLLEREKKVIDREEGEEEVVEQGT